MRAWAKLGVTLVGGGLAAASVLQRALERRAALSVEGWPDARWARTLQVGAQLRRGRWAPWDLESGAGALEQLVGAAAIDLGGSAEGAAMALGGVWAAIALLGSIAAARALRAAPGTRWGFGLLVLVFALAAEASAPLGLALLLAAIELTRPVPRPSLALAALALAAGFAPQAALFGVALFAVGLPLSRVRSGGAGPALRVGLGLAVAMLGVLLAAAAPVLLRGDAHGVLAFAHLVELGPPAPDGHWLLGAGLLTLAVAARREYEVETRATLLLAPPVALGVFGLGDSFAGLWPLAAISVVASARIPRTAARVGVGVLALAALVPMMKTLTSPPEPTATLERSDAIAARWIDTRPEGQCVALVGALEVVSIETTRPGPASELDARVPQEMVARYLRDGDCPWAVARLDPRAPDEAHRAPRFDGDALVQLARGYRFVEDLGPSTRALARRPAPLELGTREERPEPPPSAVLGPNTPLVIELSEPAPLDALFALDIELHGGGASPELYVHGARVAVTRGHSTIVVPASIERAAMAWTRTAPPPERAVSRLIVRALPSTRGARLTVRAVRVFEAPTTLPEPPTPDDCDAGLFAARGVLTGGLREGEDLRMTPLPARDAVHTVSLRPCPGHCLLAEAGLERGEGPVELDITYEDGAVEGLVSQRSITVGWRQPIEIPLLVGAGQLSLRARGAAGTELRIRRPRVLPCGAPYSLLNAEHEWRRIVPPDAEVSVVGDEVRVPVLPTGAIPVRFEVPLEIPAHGRTCLAVEVAPHDTEAPVGAMLGLRRGDVVHRLYRRLLAPGAEPLALMDIELTPALGTPDDAPEEDEAPDDDAAPEEGDAPEGQGEWVWLVFSTWATSRDGGGTVSFVRAQLHPCGEPTNWSF